VCIKNQICIKLMCKIVFTLQESKIFFSFNVHYVSFIIKVTNFHIFEAVFECSCLLNSSSVKKPLSFAKYVFWLDLRKYTKVLNIVGTFNFFAQRQECHNEGLSCIPWSGGNATPYISRILKT
jgi:hypothetical protein